ncbi:protein-tyrosine-phosphatase [Coemansia sp. RSA 1085]|nr:protein-tyrosine-phosphatase [Coemansia sp. RSA 1085]
MADIIDPLIPPYRFEQVQSQLYRGGYPKPRNFRFLRRQRLKTLVSLVPTSSNAQLVDFCRAENIEHICINVESPNDNVTLTEPLVSQCLELMTDPARAPLYIHCLDGSNVTGVVVMCLRKLQLWRVASLQNEYLRFEQDGEIIPEESEFVEMYSGQGLVLHNPFVSWLWPGKVVGEEGALPFRNGVHPVVPQTQIMPRKPTDICQADPLANLSRSATDPSLNKNAVAANSSEATVDQETPLSRATNSGHNSTESLAQQFASANGQAKQTQAGTKRQELHESMSASVLSAMVTSQLEAPANGKRRSRPQSELHEVLEPVLAALTADDGMQSKHEEPEADEHDMISVEQTRRHSVVDEANSGSSSQPADSLLKLGSQPTIPSTSEQQPKASEIREVTLSMLVRALSIEGLGM